MRTLRKKRIEYLVLTILVSIVLFPVKFLADESLGGTEASGSSNYFENHQTEISSELIESEKALVDALGIEYALGAYIPTEDSKYPMTYLTSYKAIGFTPGKTTDIRLPRWVQAQALATVEVGAFEGKGITSVSFGPLVRRYNKNSFRNNQITTVDLQSEYLLRIESDAFAGNQIKKLSLGMVAEDYIDKTAFRDQRFSRKLGVNEKISLTSLFDDNEVVQSVLNTVGGVQKINITDISSKHITYDKTTGVFTVGERREPFTFDFSLTTTIDGNLINYSGTYAIDYDMDKTNLILSQNSIEIPQYSEFNPTNYIAQVIDKYGNQVDKDEVIISGNVDTTMVGKRNIQYRFDSVGRNLEVNVLAVYDLTFDTNGGNPIPIQRTTVNEKWIKPVPPIKNGYIFVDWFIDPGFTEIFDFEQVAKKSTTIYAKWQEEYVVQIPAKISLNTEDQMIILGTNNGSKTIKVNLDEEASIVSDDYKLQMVNQKDHSVVTSVNVEWDENINSPWTILSVSPSSSSITKENDIRISKPKDAQAGHYEGTLFFSILYE